MKEDELFRLAFIYAEQDRVGYLDAWSGGTDEGSKKIQRETKALIKALRDYRIKRWGRTKLEVVMDGTKSIPVSVMRKEDPT